MAIRRPVVFPLCYGLQHFHEARLVRIAHRRFTTWLDPFGVLDTQVIVDLSPKVCVGMDLVNHDP
ncbi:MAG: hypothetical protein DME74_09135 [Verrucomicrobia bacterium]|nr:MAG: hypothetical protein DME74_09135 [Verrucomicrobiota bacterium]